MELEEDRENCLYDLFFFLMHTTWTEQGDRKPYFVVGINNDLDLIRLRKSPLPPRVHREVAVFLTVGPLH